jgi:lipoprotein-anchoring transpeptidase ErfK/SrfK
MFVLLFVLGWLPTAQAQGIEPLYFPATGHTLNDDAGFLRFWQSHDGAQLFGAPISEPIAGDAGSVQYFERGRLEQRSNPSGAPTVVAGPVAQEFVAALYRTFPSAPARPEQRGMRYFKETSHTIREPFLTFWEEHGALAVFGLPISEPFWELTNAGQRQVQYFVNVRLERDASMAGTPTEIIVSDLGWVLAGLQGITTTPVENPGYAQAGPAAAIADDVALLNPIPEPAPPAPIVADAPKAPKPAAPVRVAASGSKRIVVNLSNQWLYAYEGDQQVFDAPISTGRDGMETPTGTYAIYAKLPVQTMDGVLDGKYWVVPEVPNVMYIYGGVALHGTYWHNRFGTGARLSHGCVNLPLKSAAWIYQWAPVGTPVRVTY